MNDNKKIAYNTIAIYAKLIITTIISLITSRYVLSSLGQSDFGLYNVVGSIIVLINTIGIAMHSTTRRYANVEMGKGENGNMNKIFNISLLLNFLFAILFFIVAETIGIWYINNYLQTPDGKLADAHFVFQISTFVSIVGLIVIPYQGLMDAFQKFWQVAIIDIITALLKLVFVYFLTIYDGNALRFFAVGSCILSFTSYILIYMFCRSQWPSIIKLKRYHDKELSKEMCVFNNYTALGATSFLCRTQGSAMLVNYFFGTMVNGALAVAYQIQSFTQMFGSNLEQAAAPQVTQAYSSNDREKAFILCSRVTRMTVLIMICLFTPLYSGMEYILGLWLKEVPGGALVLCRWVLVVSLINSFGGTVGTYVQATGKVKWFQIINSTIDVIVLPISFVLFWFGFPPQTILICLAVTTALTRLNNLYLLWRIEKFPSLKFAIQTYTRPVTIVVLILSLSVFITVPNDNHLVSLTLIFIFFFVSILLCGLIGLTRLERLYLYKTIRNKISI